jgi:predicted nucleic acid-binding protein
MSDKVFLDTDVIIDYLTDRSPIAHDSTLLFELHEQNLIEIYISALSINNIHYISRKHIGEKKSVNLIKNLIENIEVVGTSKSEIVKALNSGFRDFEDSIQHATALTIEGLQAIITRNTKDYKKSKVAVFSPEIYLKTKLSD